ncbi:Short-chain dehydrogenase (plasmid) [Pararobbsia alpina]|uniref:SDR family oxidoreductase n=1 Tax=Pararobbsia alpina TaxID=621374 RepID=UPI0039A431A8
MAKVVVITGAGAGVGRATAEAFARLGYDVALLSRNAERLQAAAEAIRKRHGVRALAIPTDVAHSRAVEAAASQVEAALGSPDIWVNAAMATVFAPVSLLEAEEIERATRVTYLGQVHGTMAALKHMRPRNRGVIVNVGSALCYRSVPLQSAYCGAKAAVRGFTDSLRSELIHDGVRVHLTMVHLPAVNTPQFDWAVNKMGLRARPVAPIFQPEVAARAIVFAATHRRRQVYVGWSTVKAILADHIAPSLIDRYLARAGYDGQLTDETLPADAPGNLFDSVPGDYGSHGRFNATSRSTNQALFTDRHRAVCWALAAVTASAVIGRALIPRRRG